MPEIYASRVIPASIDEVWETLRDFEYSADFPYVDDIHIEDGEPPDKVGCVRNASLTEEAVAENPFVTADDRFRETLLALDDINHGYRYEFTEVSYPVSNYTGHLRFTSETANDRVLAEWSATFDVPDQYAEEVVEQQTALFEAGLEYYEGLF